MIRANPSRWFTWLFARHARQRIFGTFGRVEVAGLDALRTTLTEEPVLIVANHTTWWDPLVALWLSHVELAAGAYAMMDAANLRRLPFFGKVGAFGVDLAERRDGARAIRYAASLLDRSRRLVWIYPQGRECSPFDPLELRPGAAAVARLAGCRIVPVATRYVFASAEKPELWISVGAAVSADVEIARMLGDELARIDQHLSRAREDAGFHVVHRDSPGAFARFAERSLAVVARLF